MIDLKLAESTEMYIDQVSDYYAEDVNRAYCPDYDGHQTGMEHMLDLFKTVTRFEVIDHTGRVLVYRFKDAEMQFQDDFRTLKLFIND